MHPNPFYADRKIASDCIGGDLAFVQLRIYTVTVREPKL